MISDNKKVKKERYTKIDAIRGLAVINMVLFHTYYDLESSFDVFSKLLGHRLDYSTPVKIALYIWQQMICCTFIFISGMCNSMGGRKLKNGLVVSACGVIISLVTYFFLPEEFILYGVLTLIGASILIMIPLEKIFCKINPIIGFLLSFIAFLFLRDTSYGRIGFWRNLKINEPDIRLFPKEWYANDITAFFGFPGTSFSSSDYFPIIPWLLLFIAGYFFWRIIGNSEKILSFLKRGGNKFLCFVGRHSLVIYLIHQPVMYGLVYLLVTLLFQ